LRHRVQRQRSLADPENNAAARVTNREYAEARDACRDLLERVPETDTGRRKRLQRALAGCCLALADDAALPL